MTMGTGEARASHPKRGSNPVSGDLVNGKLIFEREGCNKCHGSQGEGLSPTAQAGIPRIADSSLSLRAFIELVRKPKGRMPPFGNQKVSDHDLANVYAFLQSVAPVIGNEASATSDSKNGNLLFKRYGCYECHGYLGQGSTQTGGSRLGPPEIPLSAFMSYVREPTGQMPPYTEKVVSDKDLADIYSYLQSLPKAEPSSALPLLNKFL